MWTIWTSPSRISARSCGISIRWPTIRRITSWMGGITRSRSRYPARRDIRCERAVAITRESIKTQPRGNRAGSQNSRLVNAEKRTAHCGDGAIPGGDSPTDEVSPEKEEGDAVAPPESKVTWIRREGGQRRIRLDRTPWRFLSRRGRRHSGKCG